MHREPESLAESPARQPEEPAPEPAWDIALLFPAQGSWDEEEYLTLSGNRLVELSHGVVEVLPMPTDSHQARVAFLVAFLYAALHAFASARNLGKVRFAPLRLRLRPGTFREPDVRFLSAERDHLRGEQYWSGADLVMEVVSDDDRRRDLVTKRHEYAAAGIDEYWIVDAREQRIAVLRRDGERYSEHGSFERGQQATSARLPGFAVAVSSVLDAA
jgi:Uma2 family endonuclease